MNRWTQGAPRRRPLLIWLLLTAMVLSACAAPAAATSGEAAPVAATGPVERETFWSPSGMTAIGTRCRRSSRLSSR